MSGKAAPSRALLRSALQRLQDALKGALFQAAAPVLHKLDLPDLGALTQRPQRARMPRKQRYWQPESTESHSVRKLGTGKPQRQAVLNTMLPLRRWCNMQGCKHRTLLNAKQSYLATFSGLRNMLESKYQLAILFAHPQCTVSMGAVGGTP